MSFETHKGRVAVITGAAQGFGRAISLEIAKRGATVVAVDIKDPGETIAMLEADGHKALGLVADVSMPEQIARVADEIGKAFARCDIIVNNAGIIHNRHFENIDFEQWRRVFAVNVDAQFLLVKALLPLMKANSWGRIVNISSSQISSSSTGISLYLATKMAEIGYTRGLANDLAQYGINVNAVGPTASLTPGFLSHGVPDFVVQGVVQAQSIKKVGQPEDIVGVVMFLTSEDSYFVTAQTIMADGGLTRL